MTKLIAHRRCFSFLFFGCQGAAAATYRYLRELCDCAATYRYLRELCDCAATYRYLRELCDCAATYRYLRELYDPLAAILTLTAKRATKPYTLHPKPYTLMPDLNPKP